MVVRSCLFYLKIKFGNVLCGRSGCSGRLPLPKDRIFIGGAIKLTLCRGSRVRVAIEGCEVSLCNA